MTLDWIQVARENKKIDICQRERIISPYLKGQSDGFDADEVYLIAADLWIRLVSLLTIVYEIQPD